MRELLEETGISSNDLQEISCYTSHDIIYYCFLCVTDCDKTSITLPASITVCDFYKKQGYTYKNGIDVIDEQQIFHLEKFRFVGSRKFQFYELNNNELWADWFKNQSASFYIKGCSNKGFIV